MWNTKDYKGNPISYYEEKEYRLLEEKLAKYESILYNIYKVCGDKSVDLEHYFYGSLKALNLLDKFFKKREKDGM